MVCPSCGTQHPDRANFCMSCGLALREPPAGAPPPRDVRWEYRDLTIPLLLTSSRGDPHDDQELLARYDQIVLDYLQTAGQDGWQAEGPTDWHTMDAAGRLKWDYLSIVAWLFGLTQYEYKSVTIRLKRPAPMLKAPAVQPAPAA